MPFGSTSIEKPVTCVRSCFWEKTSDGAPGKLQAVGCGNMRPRADNATDEGKRLNRRINAVIPCFSDLAGLAVIAARFTIASAIDFFDQSDTAALHLAGIGF
jgi:hypothetical protein